MLVNSGGSDYTCQIISWSVSRVFRLWKGNNEFFLLLAFRNKFCMVLTWSPVCSCIEKTLLTTLPDVGQGDWILGKFPFAISTLFMDRMIFVLVYFQALKRKPVVGKSDGAFMHALRLRWNFIAGTKRVIPSGQYRSILHSQVANPSAWFG